MGECNTTAELYVCACVCVCLCVGFVLSWECVLVLCGERRTTDDDNKYNNLHSRHFRCACATQIHAFFYLSSSSCVAGRCFVTFRSHTNTSKTMYSTIPCLEFALFSDRTQSPRFLELKYEYTNPSVRPVYMLYIYTYIYIFCMHIFPGSVTHSVRAPHVFSSTYIHL